MSLLCSNFHSFFFFFFFFLLFISIIPITTSLPTVSISETSNQTLVCALVQSPNNQNHIFLNCSSFPSGAISIAVNPNITFSGVVSGDGFMCALRQFPSTSSSTLLRWRFSGDGTNNIERKRIYQGQSLADLDAGDSHICGIVSNTNRLSCWQWPGFNYTSIDESFTSLAVGGDFVCGLNGSGNISCFGYNRIVNSQVPNDTNFGIISAGYSHACAISSENDLFCWGSGAGERPQGKFVALALGTNRSCALRTNETAVCWGEGSFGLPESLRQSYFISIVAKKNVFCGVRKEDFSLFCWGGGNMRSDSPVFGLVLPGSCTSTSLCPCGPIAGSGRFCSEGQSICQHCVNTQNTPVSPPMTASMPPSPPEDCSGSSQWNGKMIAFLVVGCVGSVVLLFVVGFLLSKYCKCKGLRVHDSGPMDEPGPQAPRSPSQQQAVTVEQATEGPVLEKRLSQLASIGNASQLEEFPLEVLLQATNNFSEEHRIGTGSFGSVYHGTLEDGRQVAIKRAEVQATTSSYAIGIRRQDDKDGAFINELESLSRIHHKNLVQLLGFCEDSSERILVYEHMENGTLHDHIHTLKNSSLSSWPARIKVALDAARGIEYLHEYAVPSIIHRDIKTSNILLDSSWTAKVSDFGLSLTGPIDDNSHLSLQAAGTVGYMDPEYYRMQQLTTKSDVYSFGVVLLEMLSGQKAIHKNEQGVPRNVVDFVIPYIFQNDIHRVLDPKVPSPSPYEIEAVTYVGYLAADCVVLEGRDRPSMSDVVNSLERALAACLVRPTPFSRSSTGSSAER